MPDWEERYRRGEHSGEAPHPLLLEFASELPPRRALDVACGAGRHAVWLAERGWSVTAVDSSIAAIEILRKRSAEKGVLVDARTADLERHEFLIEPAVYDLIVVCNYLQRDLFPLIKAGTCVGGVVVAMIAIVDEDPNVRPMNPRYLLAPGELRAYFAGWKLLHDFEGKPAEDAPRRAAAEIVARRLR